MFMADLLLPGPMGGAVAGLTCCAAAAGAFYTFRKKIPHPTELELIGQCCLFCKCHNHKKFDLVVSVSEADNSPKGSKVYMYVECGRFEAQTQQARTDDKTQKVDFYERLNLHVRQRDEVIKVVMYKKLTLSSEEVGTIEIAVVRDLIEDDFPTNKWYTLKKDGKNTARIQLSFYKLEGGTMDLSPLMQQALIQTQFDASANGQPIPQYDFVNMDPKERLNLLSKALEGPLKMMKGMGLKKWDSQYFRLVENKKGEWEWLHWKTKADAHSGTKPAGKIFMLAVSNVLPDPGNRHQFYIKYHDQEGAHDYMFLRMDRDRDVWSDGLYEFLDRLRDYIEKYPMLQNKAEAFVSEKKRKSKEKGAFSASSTRRQSFIADPTVRRVTIAKAGGDKSVPRPPKALAEMAKEMYGDDDDDDEMEESGTGESVEDSEEDGQKGNEDGDGDASSPPQDKLLKKVGGGFAAAMDYTKANIKKIGDTGSSGGGGY